MCHEASVYGMNWQTEKIKKYSEQKIKKYSLNVVAHTSLCCATTLVCHTPKNNLNADDVLGCETFEEAALTSGTANTTMTFKKKR